MKVRDIAEQVQGQWVGNGDQDVQVITSLDRPDPLALSFVNQSEQLATIDDHAFSCLLAPLGSVSPTKTLILVPHPKAAWAKLLSVFFPPRAFKAEISANAYVSPLAEIAEGVTIEPFAWIGDHVKIGANTVIRAGAYIDEYCQIGSDTHIHPRVIIYPKCVIGNQVIIHAGSVIGSDGFGYVFTGREQLKVPQVGNVVIEDLVEIGANVTIDRATTGSTLIQKGAKIDNLVQIAHNVRFGENSVASSQSGISGSSIIGNNVILAGQVGIADHCEIGDGVIVGAQAGIPSKKKIPTGQIYFGSPARPYQESRKMLAAQGFLADTVKKVRSLEKQVTRIQENQS